MKYVLSLLFSIQVFMMAYAEDRFANVEINAEQVSGNVYILYGAGGNIGALVGDEGTLIIDDQFEPLAAKIEKAIAGISDNPKVTYVVNTHYHGDHTGSNVYFSKSASILAHENVRKRLSVKSKQGLPVITYESGVKLHVNNETVDVKHLGIGHTDGDSVIYFKKANVWHLGDLFFANRFPYVDLNAGGTVTGLVSSLETLLEKIDDDAKIIPGHGKLTNKAGMKDYLAMIIETNSYVAMLKKQGKSEQEIIATGLPEKWNDWSWAFINEEKWISTLYQSR